MKYWLAALLTLLGRPAFAEHVTLDADAAAAFVEGCRKPNGAFGPADQEYTDAAWNYPAVRALQILGKEVHRPDAVLEHGLASSAGHAGLGHYHFFHHHAVRHALKAAHKARHPRVAVVHQGDKPHYYHSPFGTAGDLLFKTPGGPRAHPADLEGETFYFHNLASLHYLLAGLRCSNREPADPKPLIEFVLRRQAANGGFADAKDAERPPADGDANVAHTLHALGSLHILDAVGKVKLDRVETFLHACRLDNGAYGWRPAPQSPAEQADVYYSWAALESLHLVSGAPRERQATLAWLNSLQNPDGGFGDRPGWRSRLYSTYYAVEALSRLGGRVGENISVKRVSRPIVRAIEDGMYRIYQAQFKMPVVTAEELDGLHKRGFNLLALKSDRFEDADPLLKAIRGRALPMDVVLCPEAYSHRVVGLGGVVLDHVGNFTLDPRSGEAERGVWKTADAAGAKQLPREGYRDKVVAPLARLGGLAYPEQDYDLEEAYPAYGDDRSGDRGYNAVLVGFNWAPHDFVRVFPWRERYVERLTPVADVDAHGDLAKWTAVLDHTRTLFIAKGPTYADFREAAAGGRVVTVVAKAEGVPSGVSYYGPAAAVEYVRRRGDQWKWWK